jgi:hypothetical protein
MPYYVVTIKETRTSVALVRAMSPEELPEQVALLKHANSLFPYVTDNQMTMTHQEVQPCTSS